MAGALRICMAGEGGQGVQTVAEILAEAAYSSGKEAIYIPNFGVEQRGGVSIAFVQISDEKVGSPKFKKADILVVLSPRSVDRTKGYIQENTTYVYDSSAITPPMIHDAMVGIQAWDTIAPEAFADQVGSRPGIPIEPPAGLKVVGIPAAEVAKNELSPRVFNVIVLGAVVEVSKVLTENDVLAALDHTLAGKFKDRPELKDLNHRAFARGAELVRTAGVKESTEAGAH